MLARLVMSAYRREGLWYTVKQGVSYLSKLPFNVFAPLYYRIGRRATFEFQGKTYKYFYHSYNTTWNNPRAIEIPIVQEFLNHKRTLEVGCVLPHYMPCKHDVLDLNERYPDVINQDIADFSPRYKYDLVISISTFEHIGCWDDKPKHPEQIIWAIHNVTRNILGFGGEFILTVPLGENKDMEKYIYNNVIKFDKLYCMRQVDIKNNYWEEIPWAYVRGREFDTSGEWCGENKVILIGVIE